MTAGFSSRWEELFAQALLIVDQAGGDRRAFDQWTFGGGTALMLQIGHRDSDDIDFFISDPQWLPLLNPLAQGYILDLAPSDYETDGTRVLKLIFPEVGEIDFICCTPLTPHDSEQREVCGRMVAVELAAEIVTKKIFYRGERLQPRDMFDIAAVVECLGESVLTEALAPYKERCAKAAAAVERMDPATVRGVMKNLRIRTRYEHVPDIAQKVSMNLLRKIAETK